MIPIGMSIAKHHRLTPIDMPIAKHHHLTPIACPIMALPQDIAALARLPNQPRRSLLDPHHPLRYADRRNGANPPCDRNDR